MLKNFLKIIFGSSNDRIVRQYYKIVEDINLLEKSIKALDDETLRNQTLKFKSRIENGEPLSSLISEAFATVREVSIRCLNMRHFDVQLIGGLVLNDGMIAEMKTGEGKTLAATLPAYLNALTGKGVHIVTVNDYLAKRDSDWMGRIYKFLGLEVGCITHDLNDQNRKTAYLSDITYGTNHEFGFDYLRDNMKFNLDDMVMRSFHYAIVDEVDSILIDEARTPLIISGPSEDSSHLYKKVNILIKDLDKDDYEKDEKNRIILLTDKGVGHLEEILLKNDLLKGNNLYDSNNLNLLHYINQALKAHILFIKDVDYIIKDKRIIIIDEFTGRMMEGRRYSEGLHQALEAKENLNIQSENQTLASVTYQNFFRLYPKLAGMTGTAITEAEEFNDIYNLFVVEIPTNLPIKRKDFDDSIYLTNKEKYQAILDLIKECLLKNQPVLVGTTSIERSEYLSEMLKENRIKHQVLNARYHEKEAMIIADAGRPGSITIATNMAGRGTDIKLGGNFEELTFNKKEYNNWIQEVINNVKDSGGLYVIGTERHESRRIDNQLRGRSGRQGDPGSSKFFISLEDDLMRIFGSDKLESMLRKLGIKDGEAISHPWINKALERAQKKVESRNFDIRKQLLKYDDVMNDQRRIIYEQRKEVLSNSNIRGTLIEFRNDIIHSLISRFLLDQEPKISFIKKKEEFIESLQDIFEIDISHLFLSEKEELIYVEKNYLFKNISELVDAKMERYDKNHGVEFMMSLEKSLFLRLLDQEWKDHLLNLEHLKQGINLRAYAHSNPLNEYKKEAFKLFQDMLINIKISIIKRLFTFDMSKFSLNQVRENSQINNLDNYSGNFINISRNSICYCGTGRKYKYCHGRIE